MADRLARKRLRRWSTRGRRTCVSEHLGGQEGRLLPVRFDDMEIPGLPGTIAYLDLRALTPAQLAELIKQKIDSEPELA